MHSTQGIRNALRRRAHQAGLQKLRKRIGWIRHFGVGNVVHASIAKLRYFPRIDSLPPLPRGHGPEVHMLLNHRRTREGAWALYSLAHHGGTPLRVCIHDDGTLNPQDSALLRHLFPNTRIVSRPEANETANTYFARHGLANCRRFRDSLIFALKLFDPFLFCESEAFVLLDSDILFYAAPHELLGARHAVYSVDNGDRYPIRAEELEALIGRPCITRFNPGILRSPSSVMDFHRVEQYLNHAGFWNTPDKPHYFAELTLWAMELSAAGAVPLPATYAINARDVQTATAGHYCCSDGPSPFFYGVGVPHLYASVRARHVATRHSR